MASEPLPVVHVVVVDKGPRVGRIGCLASVENQKYAGKLKTDIIGTSPDQSGGTFSKVMQLWLQGGARYGICLHTGYLLPSDRVSSHVAKCMSMDLSATYGDVLEVGSRGESLAVEQIAEFVPDMIGMETIPLEAMTFDLAKLRSAGGFDYIMAGSRRPDAYMVAMAACGGRIAKTVPGFSIHRVRGGGRWGPGGASLLAWGSDDDDDFWQRFQVDRFISQARAHFKERGW